MQVDRAEVGPGGGGLELAGRGQAYPAGDGATPAPTRTAAKARPLPGFRQSRTASGASAPSEVYAAATQATAPLPGAWLTAIRVSDERAGAPVSRTVVQVAPPSADRRTPSSQPASTSPPSRLTDTLQQVPACLTCQVVPPSVDRYRPPSVAANSRPGVTGWAAIR